MYKILILGNCRGPDLYFSLKDKIRIVHRRKEIDTEYLKNFDAVIFDTSDFSSKYSDRLKRSCLRRGIPYFSDSAGFLRMVIETTARRELPKKKERSSVCPGKELFIGNSAKICELKEKIGKLASQDCRIFIVGETGTGKEILAESIYRQSGRTAHPFVKINCASIPPSLAESQMFGTEPGAYTDAVSSSGFLEKAHGGTLFLDEIPDLLFELQAKFLRVLEDKEFFRVGGKKRIRSDFRLLSASNRPGTELFRGHKFRSDLLYRISECVLEIPPLRERSEDIPLLCRFFLSEEGVWDISDSAMDKLMSYRWPGNVRELKNVLRRSLINASGRTLYADDIVFN